MSMQYTQRVRADGYHWAKVEAPGGRGLAYCLIEGEESKLKGIDPDSAEYWEELDSEWEAIDDDEPPYHEYDPMDRPDLFSKFAEVDTTVDGILRFARRCGMLGMGSPVDSEDNALPDAYRVHMEYGRDWVREIRLMRGAVEILGMLEGPGGLADTEALSAAFQYKDGSWYVRREYLPGYTNQGNVEYVDLDIWAYANGEESFVPMDPGDAAGAAREMLRILANSQLAGRVSVSIGRDKKGRKLELAQRPDSLLGAMWLQFADVLTQPERKRICPSCGTVFTFERRTKLFCSEACQKRWSRRQEGSGTRTDS